MCSLHFNFYGGGCLSNRKKLYIRTATPYIIPYFVVYQHIINRTLFARFLGAVLLYCTYKVAHFKIPKVCALNLLIFGNFRPLRTNVLFFSTSRDRKKEKKKILYKKSFLADCQRFNMVKRQHAPVSHLAAGGSGSSPAPPPLVAFCYRSASVPAVNLADICDTLPPNAARMYPCTLSYLEKRGSGVRTGSQTGRGPASRDAEPLSPKKMFNTYVTFRLKSEHEALVMLLFA